MNAPCTQHCPDRSPTCHAKCKSYQEYVKLNAAERDRRYRESEIDRYIGEKVERAIIIKSKRRNKRST